MEKEQLHLPDTVLSILHVLSDLIFILQSTYYILSAPHYK